MIYFSKIVEFCRRNNIQLDLMIHPYHAQVIEIMHETGIWPAFEAWKRQLTAVLAADTTVNPDKPKFELWDFSGYSPITTETVPPAEDIESKMRWYWESSHYKSEVGIMIGRRMYRLPKEHLVPGSFGVALNTGNLEAHLKATLGGREIYRRAHRREMRELNDLYQR